MSDYRRRPPVDAPRPTPLAVLRSTPFVASAAFALMACAIGAGWYGVAIACGLAW